MLVAWNHLPPHFLTFFLFSIKKHLYCFIYFSAFYRVRVHIHTTWSWAYGCWIYNYLCNQRLSPLKLWIQIPLMVRCTRYNIMWYKVCQWLATGRLFSPDTPVSSTNNTDLNDITEILSSAQLSVLRQTWFIRNTKKCIYYWNLQFLNNIIINKTNVLLPQS